MCGHFGVLNIIFSLRMRDCNVNAFNNLWIIKVCCTALTFSTFGNFDWVAILSLCFLIALLLCRKEEDFPGFKTTFIRKREGQDFVSMCQTLCWVFYITFLMQSSPHHWWGSIIRWRNWGAENWPQYFKGKRLGSNNPRLSMCFLDHHSL